MRRHLMLIPSYTCPAKCNYCFGPRSGTVMSEATLGAVLEWIDSTTEPQQLLEITFHGGEPLYAGVAWYKYALARLRERFGKKIRFSIQSNLWLLNDSFCDIFCEYNVSLGVSLDGPEVINDSQRGKGYFARAMHGINTAQRHGLSVGTICTFTRLSAPRWREVFDFFQQERLSFSVHGVIPTLGSATSQSILLTADEYAHFFIAMFDYYLENIHQIRISTFDQMIHGLTGNCGVCTFSPCLGRHFTITPEGGIYSCNRFTPHPEWQIGTIRSTLDEMSQTSAWQRLKKRENEVKQDCGDCPYFTICNGGCVYHALSVGTTDLRDGFCEAYKRIFSHISKKALDQVFSTANLTAIAERRDGNKHGLFQKGPLLEIIRGSTHPSITTNRAREVAANVALATSASPAEGFDKLNRVGLINHPERAMATLQNYWIRLHNNLSHYWSEAYIHVTNSCNLACTHCYASSSPKRSAEFMSIDKISNLLQSLATASFRSIKITGGEPLIHPDWKKLQDLLTNLRRGNFPSRLVLRTNLTKSLSSFELMELAQGVDHIIVSIDGDQVSHDKRRGARSYIKATTNLNALAQLKLTTPITLAATLTTAQWDSEAGKSVRALASKLNFGIRFRPVLPLGRAASLQLMPELDSLPSEANETISLYYGPRISCSLGHNLHVEVDGTCYPCFALINKIHFLGNVFKEGLENILVRNVDYMKYTVNTNIQCHQCPWRHLCGGFCRVWGDISDPDAPPQNCDILQKRAASILHSALEMLEIPSENWRMAGLPYDSNEGLYAQ